MFWGFSVYCGCKMNWAAATCMGFLMQLVLIPKQTSHNHCFSSLSATRVTTLNQPLCGWNNQLVFAVVGTMLVSSCQHNCRDKLLFIITPVWAITYACAILTKDIWVIHQTGYRYIKFTTLCVFQNLVSTPPCVANNAQSCQYMQLPYATSVLN